MRKKHIIIFGGSSLIAKELIEIFQEECDKFSIFCRNRNIVEGYIENLKNCKINIHEADLLNLEKNLTLVEKLENDIDGLIWISGFTGNAEKEFLSTKEGEENIRINFLNPILITNKIIPKMSKDGNSFIVALSSVAGLRGRAKQLFYSSAKSALITYMSGLRQKFDKKINIITVVPGYIRTNTFEKGNWKAPSFLISSPHKAAKIIYKAIKYKKEIVYINFIWRLIMFFIVHIPEKIFMKLKF